MGYYEDDGVYRGAAESFAEMADTYDARMAGAPVLLLESTETLSALPDLTDAMVADFACGTGRYAIQMARMGAYRVVGMDIAPEMLAMARRKVDRAEDGAELPITWEVGDITREIPAEDAFFDTAVCALTLSFLPDIRPALVEMARCLKPNGVLVISDYHPHGLMAARADSVAEGRRDKAPYLRFTTADGEECRVPQTPHTIADLFTTAREAGLTLEHIAEPTADRRLAYSYASIRNMVGLPLALVLRFRKG